MKKDHKLSEEMQLAEKSRETLEFFDLATRDWNKMSLEVQNRVLDRIKFDLPLLRPEERELVKNKLVKEGIITTESFDKLVRKGSQITGIPLLEKERYSLDDVNQIKLDELLEKAIPKEGFIKNYIDTFSKVTDTPKVFLFWGAMVAVATVLGKNVYIPWEARRLYPNIWCVFLAPSGFRKGTGIDIPTRLLRRIDETLLLPQVGSEEGLTKALDKEQGQEVGFVRWQEFSKILRAWANKQSWQASQEYWIDLWDGKPLRKKLSGSEFNIPETSISFLSASTPKTFSNFFNEEDLEGGFFGRIYLITCAEKKRYFAVPPAIEDGALNPLVKQLHEIKENYNENALSYKEFEDAFTAWAKETQEKHKTGFLDSFYSRIETHCIKLAMIYEAATTKEVNITEQSFIYAVNALEFLVASAYPLVSETGLTETEKMINQTARYIEEKGEVRRSEVMQNLHLTAQDMDDIERTLIERELIDIGQGKHPGRGRKGKIYLWGSNSTNF